MSEVLFVVVATAALIAWALFVVVLLVLVGLSALTVLSLVALVASALKALTCPQAQPQAQSGDDVPTTHIHQHFIADLGDEGKGPPGCGECPACLSNSPDGGFQGEKPDDEYLD